VIEVIEACTEKGKVVTSHHSKENSAQTESEEYPIHHIKEVIRKPYVISEDIHVLLQEWAERKKFAIPSEEFFGQLRKNMKEHLCGIFGLCNVDMVSVEELRNGLRELLKKVDLPIVSMDQIYLPTNPALHITRTTNETFTKDFRNQARFGFPQKEEQLAAIAAKYRDREIVLADDVLYSGNSLADIILDLKVLGVKIPTVVIGITIGKGARNVNAITGAKISTVRYYKQVEDEICERDFYPGVPLSGRSITGFNVDVGAPYIHPFDLGPDGTEHMSDWATIHPERQERFSIFCLEQAIMLWEEIERLSQKNVLCRDLDRIPIGLHNHHHQELRLVDCLKKYKD